MPLIGNKVVEKDLRDHLSASGYYGQAAVFRDLDLVAIQRPGWTQIFRFHVRAKTVDGDWDELYGACIDDERYGRFEVVLSESEVERDTQISEWSGDAMIGLERPPLHWLHVCLLCLFVVAMAAAGVAALAQ